MPVEMLRSLPQKRIAIVVPAWHEAAVISDMLKHNLSSIGYGNHVISAVAIHPLSLRLYNHLIPTLVYGSVTPGVAGMLRTIAAPGSINDAAGRQCSLQTGATVVRPATRSASRKARARSSRTRLTGWADFNA
jgi:hypothetical protein